MNIEEIKSLILALPDGERYELQEWMADGKNIYSYEELEDRAAMMETLFKISPHETPFSK